MAEKKKKEKELKVSFGWGCPLTSKTQYSGDKIFRRTRINSPMQMKKYTPCYQTEEPLQFVLNKITHVSASSPPPTVLSSTSKETVNTPGEIHSHSDIYKKVGD